MKALIFKRYGKPDQITFADIPRPTPKPDDDPIIPLGEKNPPVRETLIWLKAKTKG